LLNLSITNLFLSNLISRIKKTVLNQFSNRLCHYFLLITTCAHKSISLLKYTYTIYSSENEETLPGIPEVTEEMSFPENDQQTQLVPSEMYWTTFCAEEKPVGVAENA